MSSDIRSKLQEVSQHIDTAQKQRSELESALGQNRELLEKLKSRQRVFDSLAIILAEIDKLQQLGTAGLVWGKEASPEQTQQNRDRMAATLLQHGNQLAAALEHEKTLQQQLDDLDAKSLQMLHHQQKLQDEISTHQAQFVVEREISQWPLTRSTPLPWANQRRDAIRMRAIMITSLVASVLLGYVVQNWKIPEPERVEVMEIPARIATFMVKKKPPPPPPQTKAPAEEDVVPQETAEREVIEEKQESEARLTAEKSGLLAFKQEFAEIIDASSDIKMGSQATINRSSPLQRRSPSRRNLLTSQVQMEPGALAATSVSRTEVITGENTLKQVEFTRVESPASEAVDTTMLDNKTAASSRSDEEIQLVFDRYKDALYRIYNRELRKNQLLKGKLVLQLTIEASGKVSKCIVASSDLNSAELEKKIVARVLLFNFGEKTGADSMKILYPINFLPAA